MGQVLLVPILVVIVLGASLGIATWNLLSHSRARGDMRNERTVNVDIVSQRHLAECYRDGCAEHRRSPVFSCAWRLVIVEETHGADDTALAAKDCSDLSEKERRAAEHVRDTLLKQVHAGARKTHL